MHTKHDGRRFQRRPGPGWKHIPESSVWEHATGLRIHMLGTARLPDGSCVSWMSQPEWDNQAQAKREQGWNHKRALMVWGLSLLPPNAPDQVSGASNQKPK